MPNEHIRSAKAAVGKMSDSELLRLCEGADCWHTAAFPEYGIPSAMMCDGPHGLRRQPDDADNLGINVSDPATCFPAAVSTACSWDTSLLSDIGKAIGEEARATGVSLVLGPGLNIKRNPLCGRNFEYFSEDPHVSGKLAAAFVRGMQSVGVGSCIKHFAANSQEECRFFSDSLMDERTLREIYLAGFETAVRESKPWAVMSSYNKLLGEHTGESRRLLQKILRSEWGFEGFVVSDWGAVYDRCAAVKSGCDLMMPGGSGYGKSAVLKALRRGKLSRSDLEKNAERVAEFALRSESVTQAPCDMMAHHRLARRAASESAVLMKNEGALPLRGSACMIGHMAKDLRYQGVGSSHINPFDLKNPIDCADYPFAEGCRSDGSTDDKLIHEAVELAKSVHTPVVFAGLCDDYESEGFDRRDMRMPDGHLRMISEVAAANPNTVVVLLCGSVVELPWIDDVNAVLYMGLPGEAGGEAIIDLLTGKANPSGKLAESWPVRYGDVPSAEVYGERDAEYREGIFVGYRYYDASGVKPLFPFGHGLSYTSFAYSDLSCDGKSVTVTVTNTGECPGAEVVQLYIEPPKGEILRPKRELKGFAKPVLQPGESASVSLPISSRSFAVWNNGGWVVPEGVYRLCVGGLSLDYAPTAFGNTKSAAPSLAGTWYEKPCGAPPLADWEKLMGKKRSGLLSPKKGFDLDSCIEEMMPVSPVMRLLYKAAAALLASKNGCKPDMSDPTFRMMMSCAVGSSIRNICICGGVPEGIVRLLVRIAEAQRKRQN